MVGFTRTGETSSAGFPSRQVGEAWSSYPRDNSGSRSDDLLLP